MRSKNIWLTLLPLMVALAAAVTAGIILGVELLWGIALGLLLFVLALCPGLEMRRRHLRRIETGTPLVRWVYSDREADRICEDLLARNAKKQRGIVILLSVCLAITSGIFVDVLHTQYPGVPLWKLMMLLLAVFFPWIGLFLYRGFVRNLVLQSPCETIIGGNFLIWANTRPSFNERADLKAVHADIEYDGQGMMYFIILYTSTGRTRYGDKIKFRDTIRILVPGGQEDEAKALEKIINKQTASSPKSRLNRV